MYECRNSTRCQKWLLKNRRHQNCTTWFNPVSANAATSSNYLAQVLVFLQGHNSPVLKMDRNAYIICFPRLSCTKMASQKYWSILRKNEWKLLPFNDNTLKKKKGNKLLFFDMKPVGGWSGKNRDKVRRIVYERKVKPLQRRVGILALYTRKKVRQTSCTLAVRALIHINSLTPRKPQLNRFKNIMGNAACKSLTFKIKTSSVKPEDM